MTTPNYKLKDDMAVTAKHLRAERVRNDETYTTKTQIENYVPDRISHMNAISYHICNADEVINGQTPLNMNSQKITGLSSGTSNDDGVNLGQLNTGLSTKANSSDVNTALANQLTLINTKADQSALTLLSTTLGNDYYNKNSTDTLLGQKLNISGGTMQGNLNMGSGHRLIQSYNPQVNHDVVNKESLDAGLFLKANQTDLTTLSNNLSANYYNKTNIDGQLNNKADKTQVNTLQTDLIALSGSLNTTNNNLSTNYNTKTQDLGLYKQLNTFDTKIQNTGTQSSIDCSGNNRIDIKVNNNNRGYFYQPTGQATTPLGLLSNDKLQLQSELSSTSVYGSKPLNDPLNTHGLYVGGIDDPAKNVQSTVNVSQGNSQLYLTSGHANLGSGMTDYNLLAANGTLQLSGGLLPGSTDKQIVLYANSKAQALPIQADGKMGYSTSITVDQPNQFTSKTYVDTQRDTRLALTGGTLTGALVLPSNPTSNLQAATKQYVDSQVSGAGTGDFKSNGTVAMTGNLNMGTTNKIINLADPTLAQDGSTKKYTDDQVATKISQTQGDARYLQLSGGTLTGALVLPSNPTSNLQAATKQYVDSAISAGGSGTGISTSGGYAIQTSGSDIQKKFNNSTYSTESVFFGIYDEAYSNNINRRQYRMATQGTVNYTHAQYLVQNGAGRCLINLADIGSEGTQCARLSVYQRNAGNTDYENENYLQFKPLQNKIEVSVPISMITEPTYTGLNLVTKNYVDTAVGSISTSTQNKIQTTVDNNDRMTVQCNTGQVSVSKKNIVDQLQFTGNTISQVSGNSLQLQRGQVSFTLTDDGTTQNIGSNFPVIYSTQPTSVTSQDHLVSQRITDERYMKKNADSNLVMNNFKVTGLQNATASGDAVHYGQMLSLMRSFGFRRSGSISIYLGDLPLGNNFTIPSGNITSDSGFGAISAIHRTGSNANYLEIRIVHNWNTNLIRILTQIFSVGNSGLTAFNDNGFGQWITNFSNFSTNEILFWLVYEPNANDPSVQANGYTILLQEYV